MSLKDVFYGYQFCIYLIQNTSKNINVVKYYYNFKQTVFYLNIYFKCNVFL